MKEAGAIRHKLKQVRFRYLKKRLEDSLCQEPHNCVYNTPIDSPEGGTVCICRKFLGEGRSDVICDIKHPGTTPIRAHECSLFVLKQDKETIKEGFREFLTTAQLHEIAIEFPDLAALLWVLQEEAPNREVDLEEGWQDTPEKLVGDSWIELNGLRVWIGSPEAKEAIETLLRECRTPLENEITRLQSEKDRLELELQETQFSLSAPKEPSVSWWNRLLGRFLS